MAMTACICGKMKNYKTSLPCIVCNECKDGFMCFHHVKTRGAGGSNHTSNLMPLCAWCHVEIHKLGLVSMSKKYDSVNNWLINNGWELQMGKWFNNLADKD